MQVKRTTDKLTKNIIQKLCCTDHTSCSLKFLKTATKIWRVQWVLDDYQFVKELKHCLWRTASLNWNNHPEIVLPALCSSQITIFSTSLFLLQVRPVQQHLPFAILQAPWVYLPRKGPFISVRRFVSQPLEPTSESPFPLLGAFSSDQTNLQSVATPK